MKTGIDLINYIERYMLNYFPDKYNFKTKKQKHNIRDIIKEQLYMLHTGITYRYSNNFKKSTLWHHNNFFQKNNIYLNIYNTIIKEYFSTNTNDKLKYQLTDTSFIYNINGIQNIGRNKYFKNKKCTKLSFITDCNGIPISVLLKSGNNHDCKFINEHLQNMLVITNSNKYKNSNRYKQYMLADKGYDTKEVRQILHDNGYTPIIDHNKRNTKDINKLKSLSDEEKHIYKKRIKVENIFCYLKKNKRIAFREDKNSNSYLHFVFMGLFKHLFNHLSS